MRKVIAILLIVGVTALAQLAPQPPGNANNYNSSQPQTTTLSSQASACTSVGAAACTILLSSTPVKSYETVTVYVQNTGATNAITDVQVEVSNDTVKWTNISGTSMSNIAAGAQNVLNYTGHYTFIRVEGRSASGTTVAVHVSAGQ